MQATFRFLRSVVLFVLLLSTADSLWAKDGRKDVVIGEERTIFSRILNEDRTLIIGKPDNYDRTHARYAVLFLLDGDHNFHYTSGLVQYLARHRTIPDLLIIAIPNTNRPRDLTPPSQEPRDTERLSSHGGAANFQAFLADELIPWVDANYRTRPYRILIGHSFGGLFAIHTLITRPERFNAYIAISPSLQWDGQRLVGRAEAFFDKTRQLDVSFFMTAADEGRELLGGARKLAGVLDAKAPRGFEWHFEHFPLETHGTVPLRSTHQGLEFIFADWNMRDPYMTYNEEGIEGIERFYERTNRKFTRRGFDDRGVPEHVIAEISSMLLRVGRLDELTELLARYQETVKPPARVLEAIANGYRERGRTDRAIEFYQQALKINPKSEVAQRALMDLGKDSSGSVR